MKWLAALGLALILRWIFRDRRSPGEKLAAADMANDLEYLREHLPNLTEQESSKLMDRVLFEVGEEFEDGLGDGEWDQRRFERYVFDERRRKFRAGTSRGLSE